MTTENSLITDLDDAYTAVRKTWKVYRDDELNITPIMFFIQAYKNFYGKLLVVVQSERFAEGRRYFDQFASRVDELEYDSDPVGLWSLWEQGCLTVSRYDAREKARLTPPAFTIDEYIARGQTERNIALIYGFFDEDGNPDISAVRERRPWKPRPRKGSNGTDNRTVVSVEENIGESKAVLESRKAKEREIEETVKAGTRTSIDEEIQAGVSPRKIAAKHGITVDDVKKRVDELSSKEPK